VKAVVDTNVFISGLFFSGTPRRLYLAWTQGEFTGVLTPEILAEYRRVAGAFLSRGDTSGLRIALKGSIVSRVQAASRQPFREEDRRSDSAGSAASSPRFGRTWSVKARASASSIWRTIRRRKRSATGPSF